ncbi:MAG: hypothetical protein ACYC67_00860 [Prosthecobacter sp.]
MGVPQHEVMRCVANLGTILQQADVMSIGMFATFLQAVMDRVKTDIVALFACMDAIMHFRGLMFVDVLHWSLSVGWVG